MNCKRKLLAAALCLTLVGCTQTAPMPENTGTLPEKPVEILMCRTNDMDQINDFMSTVIGEFCTERKDRLDMKVELIPGLENMINHVRVKIASGNMPDLIDTSGYAISYLVKDLDKVTDLMPYVTQDPELERWIGEENLRDNLMNGRLNTITAQKNVIGYWYNKELFSKAGITPAETWPEFWSNCDRLKEQGIWPMSLDTRQSAWPSNLLLGAMIGSDGNEGTEFMRSFHPTSYNSPRIVDALGQLQVCFQQYAPPSAATAGYMPSANEFLSGNVAMFFNGAWFALDLMDPTLSEPEFSKKVGAALYPNSTAYLSASPSYVVGKNGSKRQDAAVEFIKYMVSPTIQKRIASELKAVPVNPEVDFALAGAKNTLMVEMVAKVETAEIKLKDYQAMWYPSVYNACDTLYPQMIYGELTPEEVSVKMTELAQSSAYVLNKNVF